MFAPPPPAVYDAGVPAGQVQHGAYETIVEGVEPRDVVTRFWVSEHRWRIETRQASSHRLVTEGLYDGHRTTYRNPGSGREAFTQFEGSDAIPLPGFTAAYAAKLIARKHAVPGATSVVAGVRAVDYGISDAPGTLTLTVAQGSLAPLVRTSTSKGFSQTERMVTTATDTDAAAVAALALSRLHALVKRWRKASAAR